jgi:two-component system NtrC family sensor kinase
MQVLEDGEIEICVCDEGGGIDEAVLDRIFDPFFSTRPDGEGSGLGLSISLVFVERHGGQLIISNQPEGGVLACMLLPLQQIKAYDE